MNAKLPVFRILVVVVGFLLDVLAILHKNPVYAGAASLLFLFVFLYSVYKATFRRDESQQLTTREM